MKWTKFRELSPDERRSCRTAKNKFTRALDRLFAKLEAEGNESIPGGRQLINDLLEYAHLESKEEFSAFLGKSILLKDGVHAPAWYWLLGLIKDKPELLLGYSTDNYEFIPGLLPMAFYCEPYRDTLDHILCTEQLSGMTLNEVATLCEARDKASGVSHRTKDETVKERVKNWDRAIVKKREKQK